MADHASKNDATNLPSSLKEILRDDTFHQLQRYILAQGTGKGRPPKLPIVQNGFLSNRLLLQLHILKVQHGKSWKCICDMLGKCCVSYPRAGFRHIIETVLNKAKIVDKLTGDDLDKFLLDGCDLEYVGDLCNSFGIQRHHLLDIMELKALAPFASAILTKALVLELNKFRKSEKLELALMLEWLSILSAEPICRLPIINLLKLELDTLVAAHKAHNKSKSKYPVVLEKFLCSQFLNISPATTTSTVVSQDSTQTETPDMPDVTNPTPPPSQVQTTPTSCPSTNMKLGLNVKKLKSEIETKDQRIVELEEKIAVVRSLHNESSLLTKELYELIEKKNLLISQYKKEVQKMECKINMNKQTKRKKETLRKRIQRKQKKLEKLGSFMKKQDTDTDHPTTSEMKDLKKQIKNLQSTVSNKKSTITTIQAKQKGVKRELQYFKNKNTELQAELLDLRDGESIQTRDKGNRFNPGIRKCVMALQGEGNVSAQNCSQIIHLVGKYVFDVNIPLKDLPCASEAILMADEGHVLSKLHVGESIMESERFNLHTDGTTRDHKKILGAQITLDSKKNMSTGFLPMAYEDSQVLLDSAVAIISELSDLYVEGIGVELEKGHVFKEMLGKLFANMSDRASVNKKFNTMINDYRKEKLGTETDIEFLYCNAHFLLGLSSETEKILRQFEKSLEAELNSKIGREKTEKFNHFKSSESATGRLIRMSCSSLGPRGDEKSGCRDSWLAYCDHITKKSEVGSFRSNRFNNFFHAAVAMFHHQSDVCQFLGGGHLKTLNLKLQSVLADNECEILHAIVRAVGILYMKVTRPYWLLVDSSTEYVDFHKFVQKMHASFEKWINAPELLLQRDTFMFDEFKLQPNEMFDDLYNNSTDESITLRVMKDLLKGFKIVTERQLSDFLPGGKFSQEVTDHQRALMKHCYLSNLVGEYAFGDLDFFQKKMRHCSLYHHSTIHMLKRNMTISKWLDTKCESAQQELLAIARKKGKELRSKHREIEIKVIKKTADRMAENVRYKELQLQKVTRQRQSVINLVMKQGGLCKDDQSLEQLLKKFRTETAKREVLKNQVRYLKDVLGVKAGALLKLTKLTSIQLKDNLLKIYDMSELKTTISRDTSAATFLDLPIPVLKVKKTKNKTAGDKEQSVKLKGKRKRSDDPEGKSSKRARIAFKECRFTHQGSWVAVAYNDAFYIGEVVQVVDETNAVVKFLRCYRDTLFKYPESEDIEPVASKHVFHMDFEVNTPNGRIWCVPEIQNICVMYDTFKKKFNYED